MPGPLDHRLLFVTGKGGVGKSTVATALGMLAARQGLRTIVVELASQEHVQRAFEQEGERFSELELAPDLYTISIDPQAAMEEYLTVKTGTLGQMLGSSKMFNAFAMATPGMRELLSMGKIWELAQLERQTSGAAPYDFVVVDAPATGHGVGILRTPEDVLRDRDGRSDRPPGSRIATTIADPEFTGIVAVSTAEEMAVNETLALRDALARDDLTLELVVVNALYGERFDAGEIAELDEGGGENALATGPLGPEGGAVRARPGGDAARAVPAPARRARRADRAAALRVRRSPRARGARGARRRARGVPARRAGAGQALSATAAAPARSPDSIAPSMNPDQPLAMSDPARTTRPSAVCIARVVVLVPAGAVDRPGPAREAVGQPVVGGRGEHLIAREDLVELTLHRRQIAGVAARGVDAEPDQQLRPIVEDDLGVEVSEGVTGTDRVLPHGLAAGMDEDLDPARGLAERDRGALAV